MFELESDPAFEFADPVMAEVISGSGDGGDLFSDLLFRAGEDGETGDAEQVFDG